MKRYEKSRTAREENEERAALPPGRPVRSQALALKRLFAVKNESAGRKLFHMKHTSKWMTPTLCLILAAGLAGSQAAEQKEKDQQPPPPKQNQRRGNPGQGQGQGHGQDQGQGQAAPNRPYPTYPGLGPGNPGSPRQGNPRDYPQLNNPNRSTPKNPGRIEDPNVGDPKKANRQPEPRQPDPKSAPKQVEPKQADLKQPKPGSRLSTSHRPGTKPKKADVIPGDVARPGISH